MNDTMLPLHMLNSSLISSKYNIDYRKKLPPFNQKVKRLCNRVGDDCATLDILPFTGGGLCTRCKQVTYCSKEHQKKDWPCHKYVCHEKEPQRLKGYANFLIDKDIKPFKNLSKSNFVTLNSEYHDVRPLYWSIEAICPICYGKCRDWGLLEREIHIVYRGVMIEYYRCESCHENRRLLCPVSFVDRDLCLRNRLFTHWYSLCKIMDIYSIPYDVVLHIFNFAKGFYYRRCECFNK